MVVAEFGKVVVREEYVELAMDLIISWTTTERAVTTYSQQRISSRRSRHFRIPWETVLLHGRGPEQTRFQQHPVEPET